MSVAEETVPSIIGSATPRIDGPRKVSGRAMYASDHHFPGMLFAVPVCSTVAKGKIDKLDTSAADRMPGVVAIFHHGNIGPIFRVAPDAGFSAMVDEKRPPFEDEQVSYFGQYVAAVVAKTFEQAEAAAATVKVTYSISSPDVETHLTTDQKPEPGSTRGNAEQAFTSASIKVDHTYSTPAETHNPIELHSTVAVWTGDKLTVHESTQAVGNTRVVLSQMLGVPPEDIEVISRFLGSGFGGKLWPWPHSVLACAAARQLDRPVKLVVSRKMMFQNVGHRPRTQQRLRLSASPDGQLTSLQHDYLNHTSIEDDYKEDCAEVTPFLYSTPNLRVTSALARRNVGTPTAMRGPGAVPGLFALESAMDELAIALKIDPVELRLKNEPSKDESLDVPFSSRHLKECLTLGAQKFGWNKRNPEIGSMRKDGVILGWGVGACSWIAARFPCEASVSIKPDGSARVSCGTQDIGTGTYTILAQVVSARTGIPVENVDVVLGDSSLPPGPISGGSMVTASVIPAVFEACDKAIATLVGTACMTAGSKFQGKKPDELAFTAGRVHLKAGNPENGVPFGEILQMARMSAATGSGKSDGTFGSPGKPKFSMHSFGAHFVEVAWQPEIARLRVNRVVTVIDAGRIINPRPARNQIEGAIMMGVGMALFEETIYDPRNGAPINSNLADYIVACHADTPDIDVAFLNYPDLQLNALGARGVGEIGLAGIASAITGAVHHATGIRVRELPVRIENLLESEILA